MENTDEIKIGTIFECDWGYDQTNVDFYQVVRRTAKSVWIREINHTSEPAGPLSWHVKPLKDHFIDDDPKGERHLILHDRYGFSKSPVYLKMTSYSVATIYNPNSDILETAYA